MRTESAMTKWRTRNPIWCHNHYEILAGRMMNLILGPDGTAKIAVPLIRIHCAKPRKLRQSANTMQTQSSAPKRPKTKDGECARGVCVNAFGDTHRARSCFVPERRQMKTPFTRTHGFLKCAHHTNQQHWHVVASHAKGP